MKMNKIALACGVAMLGLSSVAAAEISMNLGVTSNYIWRGMTQTDGAPAISGGLDWDSGSGFYLGTWASNVDFGPDLGKYELDLYGGYAGEVSEFGYDVGVILYKYDSDDEADFSELYVNGSWQFLEAGIAKGLNADWDDGEDYIYYYVGASIDLPQDLGLGITVGNTDPDDGDNLTHYQIDLSKGDFTFSLSDTNADEGEGNEDPVVFVSWGQEF